MKALGIIASPRKDGNSAYLLEQVLRQLRGHLETETVALRDYAIGSCEGCHRCGEEGRCVLEDGMQALYPKIRSADVMILSSPVYMGDVTSRLRAFMERTWPLRKGQLAGKVGTFIVVGRRKLGATAYAMEDYLARLGAIRVPGICGYAFHPGEILDDDEAVRATERLAGAILGLCGG